MDNKQDDRKLIKCLASHNTDVYAYNSKGKIIHVQPACEFCNGTGWTFRQDVIDCLDKRYKTAGNSITFQLPSLEEVETDKQFIKEVKNMKDDDYDLVKATYNAIVRIGNRKQ